MFEINMRSFRKHENTRAVLVAREAVPSKCARHHARIKRCEAEKAYVLNRWIDYGLATVLSHRILLLPPTAAVARQLIPF